MMTASGQEEEKGERQHPPHLALLLKSGKTEEGQRVSSRTNGRDGMDRDNFLHTKNGIPRAQDCVAPKVTFTLSHSLRGEWTTTLGIRRASMAFKKAYPCYADNCEERGQPGRVLVYFCRISAQNQARLPGSLASEHNTK